jgi:hypothetical protein
MKNRTIAKLLEDTMVQTAVPTAEGGGENKPLFRSGGRKLYFWKGCAAGYELGRNPVGSQAVEENPQ